VGDEHRELDQLCLVEVPGQHRHVASAMTPSSAVSSTASNAANSSGAHRW